jgi:hypothetical protein
MLKNGHPVIVLFGEETLQINWTQVAASVQGNPLFIWRNSTGFTQPQSAGSFSWVGLTSNPADPGLAYLLLPDRFGHHGHADFRLGIQGL